MTRPTIKFHYSTFNDIFFPLLEDESRHLVLYGGAGSGKSVFACQKILYRVLDVAGHRFLVTRKVGRTIRHSVFQLFIDTIADWGLSDEFKVNRSEMTITCSNGSQILFSGLDDVEKLKSITRITGIWIEEASETDPRDVRQLNLRLRGRTPSYKQIILTFNPVDSQHWLKKEYFDKQQDNATVIHSTYLNNRFLDAEYAAELESLKEIDPYYYDVYCLGKWGSLGNIIFTNWEAMSIPQDARRYDAVSRGVDFGFNHPSVCLDVGMKDGDIYVLNEIYERELTNAELIDRIKASSILTARIIADSAEPDRIKEFNQSGLRTQGANKGPHSVRAGIDWLKARRIFVHPDCVNTINELQTWKYREDREGNPLDEPVPFKDDAMAALRYAVEPWRLSAPETPGAMDVLRTLTIV